MASCGGDGVHRGHEHLEEDVAEVDGDDDDRVQVELGVVLVL